MKPLNLIYRIFVWLSICPSENTLSSWIKRFRFGFFLALVTNFSLIFFSSAIFFQQNVFINLEIAIFSILQIITASIVIYSIVTAYVLRKKNTNIYKNLQQIYEQGYSNQNTCSCTHNSNNFKFFAEIESQQFMEEADKYAKRIMKRYINCFVISLDLAIITGSAIDIIMRSRGYIDDIQRYKPFKFT